MIQIKGSNMDCPHCKTPMEVTHRDDCPIGKMLTGDVPEVSAAKIVRDIINVCAHGDNPDVQVATRNMCAAFSEFLVRYIALTDGYMLVSALVVTFTEMRKVIGAAEGKDKELLTELTKAIVGSFGSTIN